MRALPVAILVVMATGTSVVTAGCGSSICTDTATCAATADGGTGSGGDVIVDSMLPDVPFVDSSTCPSGSMCVEAVPSGWSGPVILYDATGTPPPVPPPCPSTYPTQAYQGNAGPSGGAASCGCSCGAPMNADCNSSDPPVITVWPTTNCSGTRCAASALPYSMAGFCAGTGCTGGASAMVAQAIGDNATCAVKPTTNVPMAQWSEVGRVCAPTSVSGGCTGSQLCVPVPVGNGFLAKACIVQTGPGPCPSGSGYSIQHTFYASTNDTRGCSPACTCAPAQNATCSGGSVSVYTMLSGSMCGGITTNVPIDGQCHMIAIPGNVYAMDTAPSTPVAGTGSCTPSSPQPTGSVSGAMPTTVCCAQ